MQTSKQSGFQQKISRYWQNFRDAAEGVVRYHCMPAKSCILILSPVRSGSTLLKALLGSAADVSHISIPVRVSHLVMHVEGNDVMEILLG